MMPENADSRSCAATPAFIIAAPVFVTSSMLAPVAWDARANVSSAVPMPCTSEVRSNQTWPAPRSSFLPTPVALDVATRALRSVPIAAADCSEDTCSCTRLFSKAMVSWTESAMTPPMPPPRLTPMPPPIAPIAPPRMPLPPLHTLPIALPASRANPRSRFRAARRSLSSCLESAPIEIIARAFLAFIFPIRSSS